VSPRVRQTSDWRSGGGPDFADDDRGTSSRRRQSSGTRVVIHWQLPAGASAPCPNSTDSATSNGRFGLRRSIAPTNLPASVKKLRRRPTCVNLIFHLNVIVGVRITSLTALRLALSPKMRTILQVGEPLDRLDRGPAGECPALHLCADSENRQAAFPGRIDRG
jgi:hypothetical protein